jgi:hypothetical protein
MRASPSGEGVRTVATVCPPGYRSRVPKRSGRRWVWAAMTLVGVTLICLWLLFQPADQSAARSSSAVEPEAAALAKSPSGATLAPASSVAKPSPPQATSGQTRPRSGKAVTTEVERLRTRVLDSLGGRQRDTAEGLAKGSKTSAAETPGNLKDRTGELNPETMRVLNHEFMPFVRECYDQAHERNPALRGMLAVSLELAGAEELGTIIEAVEPASAINELADEELIECVRQSAFSLQLPMPLKSGRASRQLTMHFGEAQPEDGLGARKQAVGAKPSD